MARIQIPLDALTSRLNLGSRFEGVRSQSLSTRFANLRPISEFLNLSRLSKPANFGEVQSRVNYNLGYFSSNYVAVAIMLLIYSLLTNLTLLFDIIFVGLGLFAIKKLDGRDLELGFARATTSQLYTGFSPFHLGEPYIFRIMVGRSNRSEHFGTRILHGQTNRYSFFRGGGLGGRPRTPNFTPPWGRSSWSKAGTRRKPQERYFEELDSDDDDGQGVTLDRSYFGDESSFPGADLPLYTRSRRMHDYEDDSLSSEEAEAVQDRSAGTMQLALRNKEDLLVEQALERIRRAQMLGKQNVRLTKPELGALERKRQQDEAKRARVGSGSKQAERRRSSGQLKATAKESKPGKRKSIGFGSTTERIHVPDGRTATPPGFIAPGPDGRPMHTPIGHYVPPNNAAPSNRNSRSGSRSASSTSLQQTTPPLPSNQYWSPQPRYPSQIDYAPPSPVGRNSPVTRRLPDDPHWNPRPRSASSNQPYLPDPQYHQQYPSPPTAASNPYSQGRRIVSGPSDLRYPVLRRPVPVSSAHAASSELSLPQLAHHGEQYRDDSPSAEVSDDDDEDYGVQVDVRANEYGYEIRRGGDPRSEVFADSNLIKVAIGTAIGSRDMIVHIRHPVRRAISKIIRHAHRSELLNSEVPLGDQSVFTRHVVNGDDVQRNPQGQKE
ncbi:MAG: hypothetical protein Q9201_000506 [Fulgogasparrea decipioides]